MNLDLPIQGFQGATKAFQDVLTGVVPTGVIVRFDGPQTPSGWLSLDGSALNRADYPVLSRVYPGLTPTFTLPINPGYMIKV